MSGSGCATTTWYKVELDAVVITFGLPPQAEIRLHSLYNGKEQGDYNPHNLVLNIRCRKIVSLMLLSNDKVNISIKGTSCLCA
jgi:hypothetical protein